MKEKIKKSITILMFMILLVLPIGAIGAGIGIRGTLVGLLPETMAYFILPNPTGNQKALDLNIRKIRQGTNLVLSSLTCKFSIVNGTAFITSPSVDLRPYLNFKITLNDGAQNLIGWIKAAGTGETFGVEKLINPSFDANVNNWTPNAYATIASIAGGQSNNCLEITKVTSYPSLVTSGELVTVVGQLFKTTAYIKSGTSGNKAYFIRLLTSGAIELSTKTGTSSGSWVQDTLYTTVTTISSLLRLAKNENTAGTQLFDEGSVKQILTSSATGVTIVSTKGGSTFNWSSDGGINPNVANFTATISLN